MARTLVQISDLHFGAILEPTLEPLVAALHGIKPDLVIVSGDMTQRAREEQYQDARDYLARLPGPQLLLPGNHDVPLYDVFRRFAQPLTRYRRYITADLAPAFVDDEVAVVGINTARSLTFKGGRISPAQLREATRRFDSLQGEQARIVVTHHPFETPPHLDGVAPVGGAEDAVRAFAGCHVDLFLSGHLHLVHTGSTRMYAPDYEAPLLVAGTATSTRARRESNSFFVIRVDGRTLHVETRRWIPERTEFVLAETRVFPRQRPIADADAA